VKQITLLEIAGWVILIVLAYFIAKAQERLWKEQWKRNSDDAKEIMHELVKRWHRHEQQPDEEAP
jgi:hypothetical protein